MTTTSNAPGTKQARAASAPSVAASAEHTRGYIMKRLLRFGRPLLPVLAASTFFRVVQMVLGIALFAVGAWGVGQTADAVVKGEAAPIKGVLIAMVALAFAKGFIRYLEQLSGHYVAFRLLAMLRGYFYNELEPQAPAGIESRSTGDLLSRVTKDVDRVEVFYAHTVAPALAAIIVPILTLVYVGVAYDWLLALTLLPFLFAIGVITPLMSQRAAGRVARNLRKERGEISQHLSDSVQGVREVLAFGHVERRSAELGALADRASRSMVGMGVHLAVRRGANDLLLALGMFAVLVVGQMQVKDGSLTWQDLAVVLAIALLSFGPVLGVEEFIGDLEQAFAAARRIWEITDAPPAVTDPAQPRDAKGLEPSVRFEDVRFSYVDDPSVSPAVDGVSLDVPAGGRVAIVGASGSGKSTLVSLLLRFWDPKEGRVLIGGHDVSSLSLDDLRSLVAVVSQRTYLFNDTVEANLRLARPNATQAELEEACRRASLHDTIAAMPDGYKTVVGEMGERLSGGQRQRLAIARALLKDSPIVVLDEATSNLDVNTESEIQAQLDEVARSRTVIAVAHRLRTVVDADVILVMDQGHLVEQGRHEDLVAAGGIYSRLWQTQTGDLDTV
jgi:ATP-binding cassette subfamily C protein CydC